MYFVSLIYLLIVVSTLPASYQVQKRSDQYQKQLLRAEEDRKQALVTSESLAALWQKKFEKAQVQICTVLR